MKLITTQVYEIPDTDFSNYQQEVKATEGYDPTIEDYFDCLTTTDDELLKQNYEVSYECQLMQGNKTLCSYTSK